MPAIGEGFPCGGSSAGASRSCLSTARRCRIPTGAKSAQLFLCVSPQGSRGGKEHRSRAPRAPGRALPPAPALRHSLMVGAAGAGAGTALCRVLEALGLCFKFQGHELFPGKNGQIKQKTNNTHEGGGFD